MDNKVKREKKILEFIKKEKQIKISELLVYLEKYKIKVNQKTIQRDLNKLIEDKIISQGGSGKNTYYYISDINNIFEEIDKEDYFD